MTIEHSTLSAGGWEKLSLMLQLANVGSEVERALNWKTKNNTVYSQKAFERALELLDLSLNSKTNITRYKEIARLRETLVDYFFGKNEFKSTEDSLKKYFFNFTYIARKEF